MEKRADSKLLKDLAKRENLAIRQLRKIDQKAKYSYRGKYYHCIPLERTTMNIIKKLEYGFSLSNPLTKKKQKNWNKKFSKYHIINRSSFPID